MSSPFAVNYGDAVLPSVHRGNLAGGTRHASLQSGAGSFPAVVAAPEEQPSSSTGSLVNGHVFVNHNAKPAMPPQQQQQPRGNPPAIGVQGVGNARRSGPPQPPAPPLRRPSLGLARGAPTTVITYGVPTGGPIAYDSSGNNSGGGGHSFSPDSIASPLRHGSLGPAPAVNGSFSGICGQRTGEEVVVADVDRRQPRMADRATAAQQQQQRDERCLRALQAEVKALSEKLRRSQAAQQRQKGAFAVVLAESEARRALEMGHLLEGRDRPAWRLANDLARTAAEGLASSRLAYDREVTALQRRVAEVRAALDGEQERGAAAAAVEAQRVAGEAQSREVQSALDALRAELDGQVGRAAREKAWLEAAVAGAENKLRQSQDGCKVLTARVAEDTFLVAQCRLFIKQVCQPGFNVVKGLGLEPVEKERTDPTGFVLVPLIVLLHGYTLLPAKERQEVIDHYEDKAAKVAAV